MNLGMYTIYDVKADVYTTPFFLMNDEVAKRHVMSALQDPETTFFRHPADYTLYKVGEWDDQGAQLNPTNGPQLVTTLLELVPLLKQQTELFNEVGNDTQFSRRAEGGHPPQ